MDVGSGIRWNSWNCLTYIVRFMMVCDLSAGCHERGDWSDLECLCCVYAYIRAISHVYIYIKKSLFVQSDYLGLNPFCFLAGSCGWICVMSLGEPIASLPPEPRFHCVVVLTKPLVFYLARSHFSSNIVFFGQTPEISYLPGLAAQKSLRRILRYFDKLSVPRVVRPKVLPFELGHRVQSSFGFLAWSLRKDEPKRVLEDARGSCCKAL